MQNLTAAFDRITKKRIGRNKPKSRLHRTLAARNKKAVIAMQKLGWSNNMIHKLGG